MNICEHLTATARIFPERVALRDQQRDWTYAELDELSRIAAGHLAAAGVNPGDRVALILANVPAFPVWYYAALRRGAIAVAISTRLAPDEVAFAVGDCQARILVCGEQTELDRAALPDGVDAVLGVSDEGVWVAPDGKHQADASATAVSDWVDRDAEDPALILYTSGTTGFPKGATLSHRNVRSNVNAFNHLCNMRPGDRILLAVPLFHCFGQNALLNSALNVGATLVMQRGFDLAETKRLIKAERVTQLYGVPMMFQLLLESCSKPELESVNYCFSAAAPLAVEVSEAWQSKFQMPIHEGYGLTETSPFASYNHRLRYEPGSIGMPIDGVEMKIVDPETGRRCPPGELGEIAIRGPNVMLGYWNREAETREAIREGWFHSGDIGRVDERGYFSIVDRVKDMIAVGGLKVFPAEVERVLRELPEVAQAAVVGVPSRVLGEQVVAFVVLAKGTPNDEPQLTSIRRHAAAKLADYKVPRRIVAVAELPHNPSGKVLKTRLRELAAEAMSDPGMAPAPELRPPREDLTARPQAENDGIRTQVEQAHPAARRDLVGAFLVELVRRVSGDELVPDPHTPLVQAGLDSLMMVEIAERLQREVGAENPLPATLIFDYPTVRDLGDYLLEVLVGDGHTDSQPPAGSAEVAGADSAEVAGAGSPEVAAGPTEIAVADRSEIPTPGQSEVVGQSEIVGMSEAEATAELMRELEN